MQHPDDVPSLPKLPFLIGDALLLLAAAYIASHSDSPLGTAPLLAISVCVGVGAILAVIPFVVSYARRQEDALEERQFTLSALVRDTAATAEQISIAASSLPDLAQHAAQAAKISEHLPKLIQDKIHLLKEALAEASDAEIENLRQELGTLRAAETEKLESIVEKIDQTATRLDQLLTRWEKLPAQTEAAAKELQSALKAAGKTKSAPTPAHAIAPAPIIPPPELIAAAEPAPMPDPTPEPEPEPTPVLETKAPVEPSPEPVAEEQPADTHPVEYVDVIDEPEFTPPPIKPAPRRKAPPPIDDNPDLFEANPPDDEPVEASTARSADGTTRLIVTAYIGIGNKLYLRGEGPGLHPEQGVPLQFVSIGKWRWETDHADAPIKIRLYKNDQIECTALGEITLEPAHQHEVSATF